MICATHLVLLFAVFISLAAPLRAGFVLSVGSNVPLLPDTQNQAVDVFLTSTAVSDPSLRSMQLRVYLGNSKSAVDSAAEGIFQGPVTDLSSQPQNGIQLVGADFFWGTTALTSGTAPLNNLDKAIGDVGVNLGLGNSKPVGNGVTVKVATLKIDTSGLHSGTFRIIMNDEYSIAPGSDLISNLTNADGVQITVNDGLTIENGSFTITAVPEPSSLILAGGLAVLGAALRLRRPRRSRVDFSDRV